MIIGEDDGGPDVFAALLSTCVELGYDKDIAARRALVKALLAVTAGQPFPSDIIKRVSELTGKGVDAATVLLRPQVAGVLDAMRRAIQQEEEETKKQLDAAAKERIRKDKKKKTQLMGLGLCPAGYKWHREGEGFRCNGGMHYVTERELAILAGCSECDEQDGEQEQ